MEIRIAFEEMESSALAEELATARLSEVFQRFDALRDARALITLRTSETSDASTPDLFQVELRIETGLLAGLLIGQSAPSLFVALAIVGKRLTKRSSEIRDGRLKGAKYS